MVVLTEENFTNEITYDDGWQSASCPEYSTPAHTETEEESPQNTELPPQKRKNLTIRKSLLRCSL